MTGCGGGGNTTTTGCTSCSTKPAQHIAVADDANNRVMIFDEPISTGENASIVLGAAGFTQSGSLSGPSGMNDEVGIAADLSGNLYIADLVNNRVLQFVPPFSNGMNASIVFGQSNLTTYTVSSSASGLDFPVDVAIDASGNLWVSDGRNDRVLKFASPFSSGMAASIAIGQGATGATQG